jgi:hypothetical protein
MELVIQKDQTFFSRIIIGTRDFQNNFQIFPFFSARNLDPTLIVI